MMKTMAISMCSMLHLSIPNLFAKSLLPRLLRALSTLTMSHSLRMSLRSLTMSSKTNSATRKLMKSRTTRKKKAMTSPMSIGTR